MSLLSLVPKKDRPIALLVAALEYSCETSIHLRDGIDAEEYREMLSEMLEDAAKEGVIKGHRRILDRFELIKIND